VTAGYRGSSSAGRFRSAYVVDFVCLRHRLIIESDGPFHDAEHDRGRDGWLAGQGFRVLRFSEFLVRSKREGVLAAIVQAATRR
jgi:very-short-patch-repair endonuclease